MCSYWQRRVNSFCMIHCPQTHTIDQEAQESHHAEEWEGLVRNSGDGLDLCVQHDTIPRPRIHYSSLILKDVLCGCCRREVYHIQRELLRERTRCKALEEELENPMNIHRWRKLEVCLSAWVSISPSVFSICLLVSFAFAACNYVCQSFCLFSLWSVCRPMHSLSLSLSLSHMYMCLCLVVCGCACMLVYMCMVACAVIQMHIFLMIRHHNSRIKQSIQNKWYT